MQLLEIKPHKMGLKMSIDRGELQIIYENLADIDIKKDIKNILTATEKWKLHTQKEMSPIQTMETSHGQQKTVCPIS